MALYGGNGLDGALDEVALFTGALTAAQIQGHYRAGLSTYARTVLADGPAGYWRFGETAGTVARDTSGNGKHGTYYGNATVNQPGALGTDGDRAAGFDGSDDYVSPGDVLDFTGTAPFTVEAWVFPAGDHGMTGRLRPQIPDPR